MYTYVCTHSPVNTHIYEEIHKYTCVGASHRHAHTCTHIQMLVLIYTCSCTQGQIHTHAHIPLTLTSLPLRQRPISFPSSTATHLLLMKFTFLPHRAIGERETRNCGNILSLLFSSLWPLDRSMTRNKRLYPNSMRIDMPLKELSAWLLWAVL